MPEGAVLNNYQEYTVQDLIIKRKVTCFRVARYKLPDGSYKTAPLPQEVNGHFGNGVKQYILHQYHACHVTQQKIHKTLIDIGIQISEGQINNILLEETLPFEQEYDKTLEAGIAVAKDTSLEGDDSGHRHKGKNATVFVIRNKFFTYFKSTNSKSRVSLLKILRGKNADYAINEVALAYFDSYNPARDLFNKIEQHKGRVFANDAEWNAFLEELNINAVTVGKNSRKVLLEAVLLGSAVEHGLDPHTRFLSDGASTYDILVHALCWIHAERAIKKIVAKNDAEALEIDRLLDEIWDYYRELKQYQESPTEQAKKYLDKQFDVIFGQIIEGEQLAIVLRGFREKKIALLQVLNHPQVPLHNNGSERDIRPRVTQRKISGGTRSDEGCRARDIGGSLVSTCRKNGISSWDFFGDRLRKSTQIPYLPDLIFQKASLEPPWPSLSS